MNLATERIHRLFPVALLTLLLAPGSLSAQALPAEQDPAGPDRVGSFITIVGGADSALPLALPDFRGAEGTDPVDGEALHAVVQRDLELSGYFDLLSPDAFLEPVGAGVALGEFSFDHWKVPGAVALIKAAWTQVEEQLQVDLHVYNVDASQEVLTRTLSWRADDPRTLGHRISNAIIESLTGERGVFDTQIVAVANFGQGKEVYVFDYDGSNPKPVSRNGSINLSPAWSPAGDKISYTSYRDDNPDLWVTDLRTGRHQKISSWPGINAGAEWAPEGGELALTLSKDGDSDIYALQPDGSIIRKLTRQYGIDVSPTYSPDGKTICFVSSRNGSPQLFLMDRDGENVRRLTHRGGHNVAPSYSPDGRKIAFAGRDEGRFDIFVVNSDGTGLKRLTQTASDDEDPTWSPDANHILFTSARDGRGKQLYLMTADGSNQVRLTNGNGSYSNPQWGPDPLGRRSFQ